MIHDSDSIVWMIGRTRQVEWLSSIKLTSTNTLAIHVGLRTPCSWFLPCSSALGVLLHGCIVYIEMDHAVHHRSLNSVWELTLWELPCHCTPSWHANDFSFSKNGSSQFSSERTVQFLINVLFQLPSVFTVYQYILPWTPAAGWAQEVAILPTGHYCVEFG